MPSESRSASKVWKRRNYRGLQEERQPLWCLIHTDPPRCPCEGEQASFARRSPCFDNLPLSPNAEAGHAWRMQAMGRMMVVAGLVLVVVGALVWWLGPRFGGNGGLLPGDFSLRRGNVSFHFPIVTCVVVSIVLTLLLRLFQR